MSTQSIRDKSCIKFSSENLEKSRARGLSGAPLTTIELVKQNCEKWSLISEIMLPLMIFSSTHYFETKTLCPLKNTSKYLQFFNFSLYILRPHCLGQSFWISFRKKFLYSKKELFPWSTFCLLECMRFHIWLNLTSCQLQCSTSNFHRS